MFSEERSLDITEKKCPYSQILHLVLRIKEEEHTHHCVPSLSQNSLAAPSNFKKYDVIQTRRQNRK